MSTVNATSPANDIMVIYLRRNANHYVDTVIMIIVPRNVITVTVWLVTPNLRNLLSAVFWLHYTDIAH